MIVGRAVRCSRRGQRRVDRSADIILHGIDRDHVEKQGEVHMHKVKKGFG